MSSQLKWSMFPLSTIIPKQKKRRRPPTPNVTNINRSQNINNNSEVSSQQSGSSTQMQNSNVTESVNCNGKRKLNFDEIINNSVETNLALSGASKSIWLKQQSEQRNAILENQGRLLSRLVAISEEHMNAHLKILSELKSLNRSIEVMDERKYRDSLMLQRRFTNVYDNLCHHQDSGHSKHICQHNTNNNYMSNSSEGYNNNNNINNGKIYNGNSHSTDRENQKQVPTRQIDGSNEKSNYDNYNAGKNYEDFSRHHHNNSISTLDFKKQRENAADFSNSCNVANSYPNKNCNSINLELSSDGEEEESLSLLQDDQEMEKDKNNMMLNQEHSQVNCCIEDNKSEPKSKKELWDEPDSITKIEPIHDGLRIWDNAKQHEQSRSNKDDLEIENSEGSNQLKTGNLEINNMVVYLYKKTWILGRLKSYIPGSKKWKVMDVDDEENIHACRQDQIFKIPSPHELSLHIGNLIQIHEGKKLKQRRAYRTKVMALYPDTTAFYRGNIGAIPGADGEYYDNFKVTFENDSHRFRSVPPRYVFPATLFN
jgi:hypothetical protein